MRTSRTDLWTKEISKLFKDRKFYAVVIFLLSIVSLIFITTKVNIDNYKFLYSLSAAIVIVGVLFFWSLSFPKKFSQIKKPSKLIEVIFVGLIVLFVGGVFASTYISGAIRPLKILSGECYLDVTYRSSKNGGSFVYDVVFPDLEKESDSYDIAGLNLVLSSTNYQATVRGNFEELINIEEGGVPDLGKHPCKSDLEVKAIDSLTGGFDYVVEVKEL